MRALLLGVVVALATAGCVDPDPSSPTVEDLRDLDVSPDHTVTVDEGGFDPADLAIAAGEVVLLVNEGDEPHSFTAETRFDTGRLLPGESTTLVLTEPGEIPYQDLEDPDHEGSITVAPAAG